MNYTEYCYHAKQLNDNKNKEIALDEIINTVVFKCFDYQKNR